KEKKDEFGKGSIRGLVAPESANNAASSGSFVPLLTLGIPGSGTTAIMLGALIAYGIQPGPRLFVEHPDVFWSVIISMYFGNIVLVILNLPLIPYISKLLAVPRTVLLPMILFFSITGVYLVSFNTMDVFVMLIVAMAAIALRLANFPLAPLLLGFILGGLMEENLRRALMISDGELSFLWERPITLTFTVLAVLVLASPLIV
ncbi:tripartite tricarboxylate transporter permease, partial [Vibrio parahaemolyticus]|nr:tripartite tricarboxylate transporter permease [Vibrio parahaemolyticus]